MQVNQAEEEERRILAALRAVLPPMATLRLERVDAERVIAQVGSTWVTVQWVGRAGAREVERVFAMEPHPDVIVGSSISMAAKGEASARDVGWVEESGAAQIVTETIVVSRSGATTRRDRQPRRWTSVSIGVAEALLCGIRPTAATVSEVTGYSTSSVALALAFMSKLGLLESSASRGPRSGRHMNDRHRLLRAYADASHLQPPEGELRCDLPDASPREVVLELVGARWAAAGIEWAISGRRAAGLLTGHRSGPDETGRVGDEEVYVHTVNAPELHVRAATAGLVPMDRGRLVLRPFPTLACRSLVAARDGQPVAPWPRVFADLWHGGGGDDQVGEQLLAL